MIVPQARLLFWMVALVLPFATVAGVYDAAALISLSLIGCFVLSVLVDALLSFSALKGVVVTAPTVVRASKDRESRVEFRIGNASQKGRRIRIGLAFPPEIQVEDDSMDVTLPDAAELSKLDWKFTGRERGNHRLNRAYVEAKSPLGFWAYRSSQPLDCQLRVYPNLLSERNNLAALFLNRGAFGIHAQRQVGKGRDFEKLREYIPGDGYDEIHWKATAKRGHPVTKVFQIERTQEIYVVIDASRLSARPASSDNSTSPSASMERTPVGRASPRAESGIEQSAARVDARPTDASPSPILERYITAALVLGMAAERQGDLFGLLTFSDKIESFVRAKNGKAHYHACRDAIYALEPRGVTPDYEELASFIRVRLRRRALLIILTALDDPVLAESFVRNMDLLCRQHLVMVNMIKPRGADPLFSRVNVQTADDLYNELRGHLQWHNLRELQKVLQRRGIDFALLDNERLSADLVSQYLSVKQRQLL